MEKWRLAPPPETARNSKRWRWKLIFWDLYNYATFDDNFVNNNIGNQTARGQEVVISGQHATWSCWWLIATEKLRQRGKVYHRWSMLKRRKRERMISPSWCLITICTTENALRCRTTISVGHDDQRRMGTTAKPRERQTRQMDDQYKVFFFLNRFGWGHEPCRNN